MDGSIPAAGTWQERHLIRDASHFRGLTNEFVRCAVRDRKDNEVLIVEMQKLLAAHP